MSNVSLAEVGAWFGVQTIILILPVRASTSNNRAFRNELYVT